MTIFAFEFLLSSIELLEVDLERTVNRRNILKALYEELAKELEIKLQTQIWENYIKFIKNGFDICCGCLDYTVRCGKYPCKKVIN